MSNFENIDQILVNKESSYPLSYYRHRSFTNLWQSKNHMDDQNQVTQAVFLKTKALEKLYYSKLIFLDWNMFPYLQFFFKIISRGFKNMRC